MSILDALARAVARLIEEAMSEQPGEHYRGTFSHESDGWNDPQFVAARAAAAAEVWQRNRATRQRRGEQSARAERRRQREHDNSPLGLGSAQAWLQYLRTAKAQAEYADYGFAIVSPPPLGERFRLEPLQRVANSKYGDVQNVISLDHGDRVAQTSVPTDIDHASETVFTWTDAEAEQQVTVRINALGRDGRVFARWLSPTRSNDELTSVELMGFNRFLNGYPHGWPAFRHAEQLPLIALRPDGRAVYEEMRALFRAAWEAHRP